jgi:hypothetical protein
MIEITTNIFSFANIQLNFLVLKHQFPKAILYLLIDLSVGIGSSFYVQLRKIKEDLCVGTELASLYSKVCCPTQHLTITFSLHEPDGSQT